MIKLNDRLYRAVLDLSGRTVVIVQRGRQWRVASIAECANVLAGLNMPMFVVIC